MNLNSGTATKWIALQIGLVVAATNACAYPDGHLVVPSSPLPDLPVVGAFNSSQAFDAVSYIPRPAIVDQISREVINGEYESLEAEAVASLSGSDAANFARMHKLPEANLVYTTDEGVLALEWNKTWGGLLLVFSGGNEATYALRRGQSFGEIVEFHPQSQTLSHVLLATIASLNEG